MLIRGSVHAPDVIIQAKNRCRQWKQIHLNVIIMMIFGDEKLVQRKSEMKNENCNSLLRRLLIRCLSAFIGLILLIKITFLLKCNIMDQKCQIYLVDP